MTKDEADERVKAAKEYVVESAKVWKQSPTGSTVEECSVGVLADALNQLSRAEAARAALDKPRLERFRVASGGIKGTWQIQNDPDGPCCFVEDILAQAEKLPQYSIECPAGGMSAGLGKVFGMTAVVCEPAILLSDLRNLINGS